MDARVDIYKLKRTYAVIEGARTRRYAANKIPMPFMTYCYIVKKIGLLCGFTSPSAWVYTLPVAARSKA